MCMFSVFQRPKGASLIVFPGWEGLRHVSCIPASRRCSIYYGSGLEGLIYVFFVPASRRCSRLGDIRRVPFLFQLPDSVPVITAPG